MTCAVKIPKFNDDRFFLGAFQFYKFHENEAKHDKPNFVKGLTVTFKIKSL